MTRIKNWKKKFDREHRVGRFAYEFGGVLLGEYVVIQTVLVPVFTR